MEQPCTSRLLSPDVATEPVSTDGASASLATASRTLEEPSEGAGWEVGLWDAWPGTDTDTEVDEVFLVVSATGTVSFEDGSVIALRPGALVRLRAGDRTTCEITERLRKLYVG